MKKCILLFFILLNVFNSDGQIINSKNVFSLSAGKSVFGGPDDIFFPKGIKNSGMTFRADYLHCIFSWMRVGVEGSLMQPVSPVQDDNYYAQFTTNKEHIITTGINSTFLLPYKASGWRNRLHLQFGISPVVVLYLGKRTLDINNTVWNKEDKVFEKTSISVRGPSTRVGLSFTPALEYSVWQNTGIRLSYNSLLTSIKSEFTREDLIINSLNIGLFVQLSKEKKLNY